MKWTLKQFWKYFSKSKVLILQAIFYIFDESEEEGLKASKAAIKRNVVIEASKLTKTRKAELIQILSGISVRNQSDDYVDLKMDEAIDAVGAERVLTYIKRDKKKTALHALVLEAIHKNVLRKDGTAVYYMDDQLGFDVESAVDYFEDPNNQTLKAQILEKILSDSWTLQHDDKDMIVMYHKFGYEINGQKKQIDSKMVCVGEDQTYTAMAKTVGLPVAIAALKILNKQIIWTF